MKQEDLRKILDYNPDTGIFTYRVQRGTAKVGDTAGFPHPGGYWRITISGKFYLAHRLAFLWMNGYMPEQVDHINGDRVDNRWVNLRPVTPSQNVHNLRGHFDKEGGLPKGIYYNKRDNAFVGRINRDGKLVWSIFTKDYDEAVTKTREARERIHGDYHNHG